MKISILVKIYTNLAFTCSQNFRKISILAKILKISILVKIWKSLDFSQNFRKI